jgi:Destabilase
MVFCSHTDPDRDGAFESCVCDYKCATDSITGYMAKYAFDCNQDGIINCEDYMHIHKRGGVDCEQSAIKGVKFISEIDIRNGFDG